MKNLTKSGQIENGATVVLANNRSAEVHDVAEVLMPGTDREEILLDVESNLYFITSMAIDGSSWAKDVKFANP